MARGPHGAGRLMMIVLKDVVLIHLH